MINQNLLLAGDDGYNLTKSLRIRKSASAYLSRTPSVAGNRNIWTVSFWAKRGILSTSQSWYSAGTGGNIDSITLNSSDKISIDLNNTTVLITTQVFRDPSAWYHIVFAVDTSQATASNRAKLYINGSLVTAFDTDSRSSITNNLPITNTTVLHKYGYYDAGILYADVYYAENNLIDGQQLTASSFGSTNSLTGVWQPAKYTGTYGTNGFYLPFTNTTSTSTLGTDFSGNSNTWTVNNISLTAGSTYDSMNDVPTLTSATTANYAVMNPNNASSSSVSITNGNLDLSIAAGATCATATMAVTSGKWYWEFTAGSASANAYYVSVCDVNNWSSVGKSQTDMYNSPYIWTYYGTNGNSITNATQTSYGATFTNGDVIGVALNMDAGTLTFYKNNTSQGTAFSVFAGKTIAPQIGNGASVSSIAGVMNFGQRPFTYTPPTGFVALNTYNLPTSTIVKGNTVMDAVTRNGFGSSGGAITSLNFKPDFIWEKTRSSVSDNNLADSVRGSTKLLASNTTSAEATNTTYITGFTSNGYTFGTGDYGTSTTLVDWVWQAGQGSTSSNTSGSITSTVSVNATAGFSVVTYTGTGANATIGHGLGVAPQMVIVKTRSLSGENWNCWHTSLGGNTYRILLNTTGAVDTGSPTVWSSGGINPTSTTFTVGTNSGTNGSAATYVAYCWTPIAGYSAFGSYTGNGSSDGPFVYLGFRPRCVIFKRTDSAGADWVIVDTTRDPYNGVQNQLFPNLSNAESSGTIRWDCLSNGFKLRTTFDPNSSGGTYIYMAFAENPFKNSLAR